MAEEIMNDTIVEEIDYVAQINELKRNTVSVEQYNKMVNENKKLLNTLVNNGQLTEEAAAPKKNIEDLRTKLFDSHNSNLEYIETALELRDRLIEEGYEDPFVPQGRKISATREDYELAEKVAEGFRACIEYANGDSEIFTQELQRITNDTTIPSPKTRRGR